MIGGPLGIMGRVVGVSCYSARGKFSLLLSLWSIGCLLLAVILMAIGEYQELSEIIEEGKSPGRKILEITLQLSDVVIALTHYTVQVLKIPMFEQIFQFTRKLRSQYDTYVLAFGLILFLCMVFDPWDEVARDNPTFWSSHRHDLVKTFHFIVFIVVLQFCSTIAKISMRLRSATYLLDRTNKAIQHHAKMIELAKNANRLWNFQLLLICFHIFGYIVLLIFEGVHPLINKKNPMLNITAYVNIGLTLTLTLTQLFCLAYSCNRTTRNAEAFKEDLFQLMETYTSYSKDEKLNMYLNFNETVNFSACGFFELGYPLITAVTATAASYLVILLQSI